MSSLLYFGPTERKMPVESWKGIQADSAPPGTYETNMTAKFRGMWKGKIIGVKTNNFKLEIRRIVRGTNLFITVHGEKYVEAPGEYHNWKRVDPALADGSVVLKMNGGLTLSFMELAELYDVVAEARGCLQQLEQCVNKDEQKAIIAALENMDPP